MLFVSLIWIASFAPSWGAPAKVVLQPDARDRAVPDRNFDIEHLNLELALEPKAGKVAGTATYRLRRLAEGPFVLDQVALRFEAVTLNGAETGYRTVGDTLVIPVSDEIARGAEATVAIRYAATPRAGLHFRRPGRGSPDTYHEVWSQGQDNDNRHWFPAWDHPNDRFVYEGTITAPDGWKVLTNSGHDMSAYLVMVAAGPYEVHGQAPNTVWVPRGTPASAIERVLEPIPDMMAHFGKRTGVPYPWGEYRQVFVQRFIFGGMENTSATVMSHRYIPAGKVGETRLGVHAVVAHELAHQWYGDLLTCRSWRDLWLNEGFATFMEHDWMGTRLGADAYAAAVRRAYKHSQKPRVLAGRFHQGPDAAANHNVYSKGSSVLQMLRVMLGEDAFWDGIRRYTMGHQRGLVDTEDLQRAMEAESGRELGWFFQQWVELPYVPELTVSQSFADGNAVVRVKQKVGKKQPRYTLPIDIEVGTEDGPITRRAWLEDESVELHVELDAAPLYVAFDPEGGLLAEVKYEQDPEAWTAQIQSSRPHAVLAALTALGETDTAAPLITVLNDPKRGVATRRAAAQALGNQRGDPAPLIAALRDPHDRVREVAAQALGKGVDRAAVVALQRVLRGDRNPDVRKAALQGLTGIHPDAAVVVARGLLRGRKSAERRLRGEAAEVLGQHGDPGDLGLLLGPLHTYNEFHGLWAASRVVGREDPGTAKDALRARVARVVETYLDSLNLRERQSAVGLLAEVGDTRSIPHLEALRRVETVQHIADQVPKTIKSIRTRKPPEKATDGEVETRLEAAEKRIEELEKTLEKLQDRH